MAYKLASNLLKSRHGIFYYRLVFPLRLHSPNSELRLSLKTHSVAVAKRKALILQLAQNIFLAKIKFMKDKDIAELKEWLKSLSKSYDEQGEKLVLRGLKLFDLEITEVEVNGEEDSRHFAEMVENLTKGHRNKLKTEKEYPTLNIAMRSYIDFISEKGKKVRGKTLEDYRAKLNAFVEIIGDMQINEITELHIKDYRSVLSNLPPNKTKKPEFKNLTLREASEKNTEETLSITTVQNSMTRVSTFCNWCVDRKLMDFNPVTSYIPQSQTSQNDARTSFTTKDLDEIFSSSEMLIFNKNGATTYTYWASLIALYTGARLEEICRLRLEDFYLDGDIPYLKITPYFDTQFKVQLDLKTINAERIIPIHPDLKRFGLFDYIKGMKKAGFYKLFPELILARDGFGSRVSKWFRRYRDRVLTENDTGKKTFHSFRHTFVNRLVNNGIDERIVAELIGHAGDKKGTLKKVYLDRPDISETYKAIKTLKFEIIRLAPQFNEISKQIIRYSQQYKIKDPTELKPSTL